MLTVKQFTAYTAEQNGVAAVSALVSSYGREYAVILEDGREATIQRTNGRPGYERLPRWKAAADLKAVTAFAETELGRVA